MRILYLDLDALNPTHLSCYGYHRNTSPTIDKIAAEGIQFNQVYTTDAPCLPSRTAFYSGQFGIHSGVVGHGGTASERRNNGPSRGFRDRPPEGLHYNIDLSPTLADLVGGQKQALWDGESYASVITDGEEAGRSELILSQCAHVCQRAVRFDDWIYIRTYHDGYRLYPRELLFNLSDDPWEMRDIAAENPDICREAAYRLMNWHDHMMETMPRPYDNDPLWTVMQEGGPMHTWGAFEDYCDRLAETDRAEGAVLLREKFGNKYRHP